MNALGSKDLNLTLAYNNRQSDGYDPFIKAASSLGDVFVSMIQQIGTLNDLEKHESVQTAKVARQNIVHVLSEIAALDSTSQAGGQLEDIDLVLWQLKLSSEKVTSFYEKIPERHLMGRAITRASSKLDEARANGLTRDWHGAAQLGKALQHIDSYQTLVNIL